MSLNFDFSEMIERLGQEEYDRITDHPTQENKWHPVTDAMIWACMAVGLGRITEENAEKFAERLIALQAVSGAMLTGEKPVYLTEEDVRNHIGMRTNVTDESDQTWKTRLFRTALDAGRYPINAQGMSGHAKAAELAEKANG